MGLTAVLAGLPPVSAVAQIQFEDVTTEAGLDYIGESWGAAVGYVNADPLPDIVLNRHRNPAALLINLSDGTFENRAFEVDAWQAEPHSDQHGGSFADFDNDGDTDIMITAGARYPSQFLVNNGAYLSDKVQSYTFDRPQWGGRHVTWFDFSRDGKLDLAVAMQGNLMQLFEQTDTDFQVMNFWTGHECDGNDYALLADMNFDAFQDLVCVKQSQFPEHIYDFSGPYPFVDISSVSDTYGNLVDVVVADLDGDLVAEFFGPRGRARIIGAEQVDTDSVEAHLIHQNGTFSTVTFRTTGDVTIAFHWNARNSQNIHIGEAEIHPPGAPPEVPITANLSPSNPDTHGMPAFDPLVDAGIFIGYDPDTETWTMVHTSGQRPQETYLYTYIDSTSPISDLNVVGLIPALDMPREPLLLKYSTATGRYAHQIAGTGLQLPVKCVSAVAADFDNDMDLDIYMVCRNAVSNAANILYMNDGTGRFTAVPDAGGAAGPVGIGFGVGLGESVVTTDYDMDGFVDLLVTNGLKYFPEEPHSAGGPEKLFRNLGNSNRWIQLDLVGVASNRDGVGAIVTLTAGGIAQRREQNGGYHRWSQNDKRLHFGLASNSAANIEVRWPSGQVDNFSNVPANAVYRLTEGSSDPEVVTVPTSVPPSACEKTAGAPTIDSTNDREMFIWKDSCAATTWRFRVSGGSQPAGSFSGSVRSNLPMEGVVGVLLEPDDVLNLTAGDTQLDYGLTVSGTGMDGFNLSVAEGSSVCAGIDANHSSALIGRDRTRVTLPVNLQTLEPCASGNPANLITTVQQVSGSPKPRVGSAVDFEVKVVNDGISAADGIAMQAALPPGLEYVTHTVTTGVYDAGSGTWDLGSLGVGSTSTLSLSATVEAGQDGKKITFAVSAASGTAPDPTTEGDSLEAWLSVLPRRVPVSDGSGDTGGVSLGIRPVVFDRVRFATDFVLIRWLSPDAQAENVFDIRPVPGGRGPGAGMADPRPEVPGVTDFRLRERQGALNMREETVWSRSETGAAGVAEIPPGANEFAITWTVSPSTAGADWTANVLRDDSVSGLEYSLGLLYVRQAGERVANGGTLSTGDILSIAVKGSRIEYRKNGQVVSVGRLAETGAFVFEPTFTDDLLRFDDVRLQVP